MARCLSLSLVCALVITANAAGFAATAGGGSENETSVRARVSALRDAVNKADSAGAASMWTLDGTYLDEDGTRYMGRDAVQKMFAELFSARSKPSVELNVDHFRLINPSVAVADGVVKAGGKPSNRFSLTFVKDGSDWRISSGTETVLPYTPPAQPLKRLAWLIGDWRATRDGASVEMKAEWVGDGNFILCRYETKTGTQAKKIEGQVIGWDPNSQRPISWHFDANGGYAEGMWSNNGDKWSVDVLATEPDGTRFSATNVMAKAGKDSFTWQSVNRRRNGTWVEDTAMIKVDRATK